MEIFLDGALVTDKKALYDALRESLPSLLGRNLDALYDCLTDLHEPTVLRVAELDRLVDALGTYGRRFVRVLNDAAEENGRFSWVRGDALPDEPPAPPADGISDGQT